MALRLKTKPKLEFLDPRITENKHHHKFLPNSLYITIKESSIKKIPNDLSSFYQSSFLNNCSTTSLLTKSSTNNKKKLKEKKSTNKNTKKNFLLNEKVKKCPMRLYYKATSSVKNFRDCNNFSKLPKIHGNNISSNEISKNFITKTDLFSTDSTLSIMNIKDIDLKPHIMKINYLENKLNKKQTKLVALNENKINIEFNINNKFTKKKYNKITSKQKLPRLNCYKKELNNSENKNIDKMSSTVKSHKKEFSLSLINTKYFKRYKINYNKITKKTIPENFYISINNRKKSENKKTGINNFNIKKLNISTYNKTINYFSVNNGRRNSSNKKHILGSFPNLFENTINLNNSNKDLLNNKTKNYQNNFLQNHDNNLKANINKNLLNQFSNNFIRSKSSGYKIKKVKNKYYKQNNKTIIEENKKNEITRENQDDVEGIECNKNLTDINNRLAVLLDKLYQIYLKSKNIQKKEVNKNKNK